MSVTIIKYFKWLVAPLVAVGLTLTAAGCGTSQISQLTSEEAAESGPVKLALQSVGGDHDLVQIFASIEIPAPAEKFEWCAGDLAACQNGQSARSALQKVQTGPTSVPIYAIPSPVRVDANIRLHFFAVISGQQTVQSFRFKDRAAIPAGGFQYSEQQLLAARPSLKSLDYDYQHAQQHITTSGLSLKVAVKNTQVTALGAELRVVVGGYALTDTGKPIFRHTRAQMDSANVLTVQAEGFDPETVYKMRLYFFRVTGLEAATFVGASEEAYFFVTGRQGDVLANSRAAMITKSFTEFWDWEMRRYDRSKGYANSGGWCVEFIRWNHLPFLKNMSWFSASEWSRYNARYSGGQIVSMAEKEAIHGDYIRMSGHSFVLLAYDKNLGKVWTIEGNYNNRVLISTRSVSSGWMYGHLTAPMIK